MASEGYEFGGKLGWRVWLGRLRWLRWWNRHSTGQARQCGPRGFSLPVVPGPLREVPLRRPACACVMLAVQQSVSQEDRQTPFHLFVLVLEVTSHHFCCSHTFAQVRGGGNIDLTHLLKARVPVGHTVRSREMGENVVIFRKCSLSWLL